MDPLTLILTLLIIIVSSAFYIKNYMKWKELAHVIEKIPGPKRLPIIGNSLELVGPRSELFDKLKQQVKRYGPIYRTWIGSKPQVHLTKPEHIEVILSNSVNIEKGFGYQFTLEWLGYGLVTNTGSSWHARRKLLTPTFHFKILEEFMPTFVENGQKLADVLTKEVNGKYFDIYPYVNKCALDIICKTAMGVDVHALENSDNNYVTAISGMTEHIVQRTFKPWLHYDFIFNRTELGKNYRKALTTIHDFTKKIITERKELLQSESKKEFTEEDIAMGKKRRLAFLDLLLEVSKNGTVLTDKNIQEEVDTFMFAGHDTTTAGITWCLFLLGNHLDIQERVYEELQLIFEGEERPITHHDLGRMEYLERVIKETLRVYPSLARIARSITTATKIDEYEIPVGCAALINIYDVHRDPRYYLDPEKFNPDNFLPDMCKKRHPYAYVPFSAGPRNCIGQKFAMIEEKVLLASILRKFKVTSLVKPEHIKVFSEITLKPQEGIHVKLELR